MGLEVGHSYTIPVVESRSYRGYCTTLFDGVYIFNSLINDISSSGLASL